MTGAAVAQINARLERGLKEAGDKGLAAAGYTSTQAIRALWELAAHYAKTPDKLIRLLDPEREENAKRVEAEGLERRRAAAQRWRHVRDAFLEGCEDANPVMGAAVDADAPKAAAQDVSATQTSSTGGSAASGLSMRPASHEALKEQAYVERYGDGMGWLSNDATSA